MWASYSTVSTDQKNSTGHMFSIKLEEKSHEMNLKALPVKTQLSKNPQGGTMYLPPPRSDRV